jgi:hypothetical protein
MSGVCEKYQSSHNPHISLPPKVGIDCISSWQRCSINGGKQPLTELGVGDFQNFLWEKSGSGLDDFLQNEYEGRTNDTKAENPNTPRELLKT